QPKNYGTSNVKIGKDFENAISKVLGKKGIPCIVVGGSGDYGIDIIAFYKKKVILIQCKSQESSLGINVITTMNSAINMADGSFGIIVYDSNKIVHHDSSLTSQAKLTSLDTELIEILLVINIVSLLT
ncbi:6786_t:CDS:2, partial [Racocetra fulgida]